MEDEFFFFKKSIKRSISMKKGMIAAFIVVAGCLLATSNALAAWTQAKGHSYNQLTLSTYQTVEKFTTLSYSPAGVLVDLNTTVHRIETEEFRQTQLSYYGEYGLTDKITVLITVLTSFAWSWVRSNDNIRYAGDAGPSGVSDVVLGVRHKLFDNIAGTGILSSLQLDVKIPEAYDYSNPATYQSLGDGQYDATIKLKFGRGFSWGYSVLDLDYVYRFENDQLKPATFTPSDQFKFTLSGGYSATSWLSIRGQFSWLDSLGNADVSPELLALFYPTGGLASSGDIVVIKDALGLEQDLMSAGVDLAFSVKPGMQIVLSFNRDLAGFGDLESKNAALGTTYKIALAYSH